MMRVTSFFVIYVLVIGSLNAGVVPERQEISELLPNSVNRPLPPEQEHFPEELNSTRCGDVLVAQNGFISYKTNETYGNNERCIWTVRTPKWETRFLLLSWGFHSVNDHISLYVMDKNGVVEKKEQILASKITSSFRDIENSPQWFGVIGPTVFVVFTSDHVGTGLGFELIFVEFGYNEVSGYVHNHSQLVAPTGRVMWPEESLERPINTFSTFVISPTLPTSVITLMIDKVDLMSLTLACEYNYFSIHQLHENGFILRLRYCEPELSTLSKISSSSPLLISFSMSMGPKQKGISFSWYEDKIIA